VLESKKYVNNLSEAVWKYIYWVKMVVLTTKL
jgi:hypothetical protein